MKIISLVIALVILFGIVVTPSYAGSFSDNFDDGNADGWWLGYSLANPTNNGNWRVENGELIQDSGFDGVFAVVENLQLANQTVETNTKLFGPSGGDGIAIWFKDNLNGVYIVLSNESLGVGEVNNNIWTNFSIPVAYNINENRWVNLKVEADSNSGDIMVFLDGIYKFTYHATTSNRIGQTGLISGNAGGSFDNFVITSDSIVDPLINKVQCKNNGWKIFTNPSFKNQGVCVSYLESERE